MVQKFQPWHCAITIPLHSLDLGKGDVENDTLNNIEGYDLGRFHFRSIWDQSMENKAQQEVKRVCIFLEHKINQWFTSFQKSGP